jgi:hypothetical protein
MPSEKRVKENIASLRERLSKKRGGLITQRREIEKAKAILSKMERQIESSKVKAERSKFKTDLK